MNTYRTLAVVLIMLFGCCGSWGTAGVAAQEGPGEPANFYGDAVDEDGDGAPAGTTIVAVVDGEVEGEITVETAGQYGEQDPFGEKLSLIVVQETQSPSISIVQVVRKPLKAQKTLNQAHLNSISHSHQGRSATMRRTTMTTQRLAAAVAAVAVQHRYRMMMKLMSPTTPTTLTKLKTQLRLRVKQSTSPNQISTLNGPSKTAILKHRGVTVDTSDEASTVESITPADEETTGSVSVREYSDQSVVDSTSNSLSAQLDQTFGLSGLSPILRLAITQANQQPIQPPLSGWGSTLMMSRIQITW